jgi:hypothetical protein
MRVDARWHNVGSAKSAGWPVTWRHEYDKLHHHQRPAPTGGTALLAGIFCAANREMLSQKTPTVQSWKTRDAWEAIAPISRVETSMEARLIQLVMKDVKEGNAITKKLMLLGRRLNAWQG